MYCPLNDHCLSSVPLCDHKHITIIQLSVKRLSIEEIALTPFAPLPACRREKGRSMPRAKGSRDQPGRAPRGQSTMVGDGNAHEGNLGNRNGSKLFLEAKNKPPIRHHFSERRQSPSIQSRDRMRARTETKINPTQMTWPSSKHYTTARHCPACSITTWRKVCHAILSCATIYCCVKFSC